MRRTLVKLHRWLGLALFLYVAMIALTGSVLVYRPELYRHFEPRPIELAVGARLLSDAELLRAAGRAFPGETPLQVWRGSQSHHAVTVDLERGLERHNYLFDPFTGRPVGPTLPLGFRATTFLLKLHAELVGGETGRLANAALALGLVFIALSGMLVWRPRKRPDRAAGRDAPRNALTLRRLHLTTGIWVGAFALVWGLTGLHLAQPMLMDAAVEHFEPFDEANPVERVGDKVSYWFAYLHFGRFGGRLPGCDPGLCEEGFKAAWAIIGLGPAFLAATGALMWLRRRIRRRAPGPSGAG